MSSPLLRNTSFGPGLFDPSQNKKIKPKDPNPYQEGTPEYVNWEGANKTYKSNKNKIYGGNKSAQEGYAAYYDNKAGDFREGSLKDFNEKERGHVIGNRKKVINYMYDNNISSLEDWNSHEIKDKDVKWLWEKNLDISQYRNDLVDYVKLNKEYNFEPIPSRAKNTKKNGGKKKDGLLVAPIDTSRTPLEDTLDPIEVNYKKRQGEPLPIPNPIIVDDEATVKKNITKPALPLDQYKGQAFPKMDYGKDNEIGLDNNRDHLKGYDFNKAIDKYEKHKENQQPLLKKMGSFIDVKYDTEKNQYEFDIKDGMSINDVKQSVEDFTVELIDEKLQEYASQKGLSGEALNILRAKAREKADIEDTVYDNYDKKFLDNFISDNEYYRDLPDEVKALASKYHDMLEGLSVLDSYKRVNGHNKLTIPKGVDANEIALSISRGASPGILNSTLEAITGIENFDLATTFKNFSSSPINKNLIHLFTNPSLVFSREYQDIEVMNALGSMLADKYDFNVEEYKKNPDQARATTINEINKAYKDIASETDTWSFRARAIANSTAELLSNLATGWRASGMVVEKIGEKAATLKKFASTVDMGKLSKMPQFQQRMQKYQQMLQGSTEIGGKGLMPTYTELFGHPVTNIARTTATAFGSHLYTHGMDFDNAIDASENMFALEVFNQGFALAGVKAYKTLNLLNRSLRKLPSLPRTEEAIAKFQKHMNTVYLASSFPAQAAFTKITNPDATDKELAGELIMNAIVGYNTLLTNRHLARQLKDYKIERKNIEDYKANWSNENRNVDIIEPHDYSRAEKLKSDLEKEGGKAYITPEKTLYDPATGTETRQKILYTDLTPGFHDYAKETVGKKDNEPLIVGDFKEFVSKDLPEEFQQIATKIFELGKDIRIESFDNPEITKPAVYDKDTKTIYLNSALREASSPEQLKSTIMHEGFHAITDHHYENDKEFRTTVDDFHKELVEDPQVKKLLDELSRSEKPELLTAYDNLSYGLSSPEELLTMMSDPLMKDARTELGKINEGSWLNKWWDKLKRLFGKGEATNIDKFREFIENYDFQPPVQKEEVASEPLDIDQEVLWQRSLVPEAQLKELNTLREEMKLPSMTEKDFLDMFSAEYVGIKPVGPVLNKYAQKLKRDLENTKGENSTGTLVNDIQKGQEPIQDGIFLEKSDVKFLKDFYNQPNMGVVIDKSQGKEIAAIKEKLRKGIDVKFKDADENSKDRIATYHANKISQKKTVDPVAIEVQNGRASVTTIHGNYYDGVKPIDKTMGKTPYLNNWKKNFTNSLRSETGRLKPYANERILSFFDRFDADNNLTTIAGTSIDGKKTNGFKNPEFITEDIAGQLLSNDYYLLPRGNKTETMLRIPGLGDVLSNHASAIDFGRQVQKFSFFRWIDSDSQWIGSKEGIYKGRELAELSQFLDFDRMIDKFVAGKNIAYEELFTVANKDVLPDDIELLGSKLKDYYTDALGQVYNPQYYNIGDKAKQSTINNLMLNSITDLMTWGIDAGGGSRTITHKDGIVSQAKNPWKYHSLLASNDPTYANAEYLKPFLQDAIKEDGSWDERALAEKGITIKNGDAYVKTAYLDPEMYADVPFMGNLFSENATDGATFVSNKRLFSLISDTMLKDVDDTAILKPKWHDTDEQGNMSMFKTALYDYGFDEYTKKMNPEMMAFMDSVKDAVGFLSFQTSNKGSNTFRTKEHPISHTDNPKAKAIFDNSGKLVDVIVKSDGEYKSDNKLFEAEKQYIKERLAQGIIDPRMIKEMPITGSNGVSFIESSHPISKTNAGTLGINQVPMFNPLFEFFRENPDAYKALENLEDKTIAKAIQGMKDVYNLRTLLEGTRRIALDKARAESPKKEAVVTNNKVKIDIGAKFPKDQLKADQATKIIGFGAKGSSTEKYANAFKDRANTGKYDANDKVFISVNGKGRADQLANLERTKKEIDKALGQGVSTFIADNEKTANSNFNKVGEGEIRKFLLGKGLNYKEENGIGIYSKEAVGDETLASGVKQNNEYTPSNIKSLNENEVFVFGSNEAGRHGAGAAKTALQWGAEYGNGIGEKGQTYALPTKDSNIKTLGLDKISEYAKGFIEHAKQNPNKKYLLTEIGTGLAGYKVKDIAPLFKDAVNVPNIVMPESFHKNITELNPQSSVSEKLLEHGFVDDETLASGGRAIQGVIETLKDKIQKAEKDVDNGNDEFMFPGLSNDEALSMLKETIDDEGKLIPEKIYNLYLAGNAFVSGMKNSKAGEKSQLIYQLQEHFEDGILSRGYGANTYIMPDIESPAAIARLFEPLIQKHIDNAELVEAEALQEQYQQALLDNVDENGRLKAFSKGVIVGKDIIEKFNLKPGDRAFLKLTPTDDLHSLTPVTIVGVSNKPGVSTFNTEFLTEVLGRDFDKDAMQIVVQHNDYMSKKDFDTVWDAYDKSGMSEGRYKKNREIKDREKQLVNGKFKPLDKIESFDPTSVPQGYGYYDRVQDSHVNVGSMIQTRNIITNGLRNLEWEQVGDSHKALIDDNSIELEMKEGMSDRVNYIVQKMVDSYDFMPINPNEAILDEFISKYKGIDFSELDYKTKTKVRHMVRNELETLGGYGVKKIKDSNDFRDVNKALKDMNLAGPSVSSKMAKAITGIRVKTSNGPEINKYKFYNDLGERLQSEATDMIAKYQTLIDPKDHHHLFDSYKKSNYNIGEHLGNLIYDFTGSFVSSKTDPKQRENVLNKDVYNYISNPDFKAFTSNSPWKAIASGTLLHDMFNNNADKDISMVKNKVYKGKDGKAYEYTYDGYNGFIEAEGNKVALSEIFNEEGKLNAEWIPGDVLESDWLRSFTNKAEIPSDIAKAQLIGKTIANVVKDMAPKVGIPEGDLFSMLTFNSTGNVVKYERSDKVKVYKGKPAKYSQKEAYARSVGSWVYNKGFEELSPAQVERMKQEVDRELRYDPLNIIEGAKQMGINPTINEVPMIDFFKKFAKEEGEKTFGKSERLISGNLRGMPDFKYRTSNLDIKTPKNFIESINRAVGEHQLKGHLGELAEKPMTEYTNEDYRMLFDKVLSPGIKKLVKDKGSKIGWDEKAIENISKQYISVLDPMHTEDILNSIRRDYIGKDKDIQLKTAYVAHLAQIAESLNQHLKVKDPTSLAFSRVFGGRDSESMLNDFSNDKQMFKRTDVIAESYKVKNGKIETIEDPITKEQIADFSHYTVGDLVNKKLGVSGGDNVYSKAFIKLIAPYKFADKIREGSMASLDKRIDENSFGKDIRGENNIRISKAIDELSFKDMSDDQVTITNLLDNINIESTFNGIYRDTENIANYKGLSAPEIDNKKLGIMAQEIIKDYTQQEADALAKFNEMLPEEDREMPNFDNMVSNNMKYLEPIKDAIKMKMTAMESANYLVGNAAVVENKLSTMEHLLTSSEIAEVTGKIEKVRELAEKLSSNDTKEVFKNFRKLNYENDKTIDLLHKTIYQKSKKTIQQYGKVRDKLGEKWLDRKYILRKEFIPEVFRDMPGSDNIPFFTLMSTKFQKDLSVDMVQNKAYSDELMSKYKNMASKVLKRIEPELNDTEHSNKTNQMLKDLIELSEYRHNINHKLYRMGNELGLTGFETPVEEASQDEIVKKGFKLRKEVERQFENIMKRLSDSYEISMIDAPSDNPFLELEGIELNFDDFLTHVNPEIAYDPTFFTYSANNLKDKVKNAQISMLGSLENVLKTHYIKHYPKDNKVAEAIVLSELGHISGNKAVYNKHYDKEALKEANIEAGTDSFVRYKNKVGDVNTIYGKILGTRDVTYTSVKDLEGNPRIEKRKMLFVINEKGEGNKLHVINVDAIEDAVTGKPYGGKLAQPTMINETIKKQYAKNSEKLLDELSSKLSKTSRFAKGNFENRRESDEFVKNVDQRYQAHDLEGALKTFENEMVFNQEQIDKSFANRLGKSQDLITNFLVADKYLGLRYIAGIGVGLGAVGVSPIVGGAMATMGLGYITASGFKYGGRVGRIFIQNLIGNTAYAFRNPSDQTFLIGNVKALASATINNVVNLTSIKNSSGKLSDIKIASLKAGSSKTQITDSFNLTEEGVYENKDNLSLRKSWNRKRLIDKNIKRFEKIQELKDQWEAKGNYDESIKAVRDKLISDMNSKWKDAELSFVNDIPFINGKPLTSYQKAQLGTFAFVNHLLSLKGKMVLAEALSAEAGFNTNRAVFDKYIEEHSERNSNYSDEKSLFEYNMMESALHKTIGNYDKSAPQYTFLRRISEMFSRFSHEQKLDQSVYWNKRREFFNAVNVEIRKDKDFAKFSDLMKEVGGLPLGGYKVNNARKEMALNATVAVMTGGLKLAGLGLAYAGAEELSEDIQQLGDDIEGLGKDLRELVGDSESWFGLTFIPMTIADMFAEIGGLWLTEDGKSPRRGLEKTERAVGNVVSGFTGLGPTILTEETTAWTNIALYMYYMDDMRPGDRRKTMKYMEDYIKDKSYETASELLPIPGVNQIVKEIPNATDKLEKEKKKR